MTSDSVEIVSPIDGTIYATRPYASSAEISDALKTARSCQPSWANASLDVRSHICRTAVEYVVARSDEFATDLAWQMGRPISQGGGEVRGFQERADHMIDIAPDALATFRPDAPGGFDYLIDRVPLGVIAVIAPWNYPLLTAVNSVVPAVMAGNTVVLKHASQTLLAGELLADAFAAAGAPEGLFVNLVLRHGDVETMLQDRLVDRVNFTGSVAAGRKIERSAAGTFMGVGLELGGKDPAYIRSDARLDTAVPNIVDGAFFNSGQSCCGIERVYVDHSIFDEVIDGLTALASEFVVGSPLDNNTTIGPMVNAKSADWVRNQVQRALASGAKLHSGGIEPGHAGPQYLSPMVLSQVDHTMSLMIDESFGPVVGVMAVSDDDEAIRLMNDSPYGLSASIWTADQAAAQQIGRNLDTGTVFMNRADYLAPCLAWTGVKDTGKGATLSKFGYEYLTRPKSYHFRVT